MSAFRDKLSQDENIGFLTYIKAYGLMIFTQCGGSELASSLNRVIFAPKRHIRTFLLTAILTIFSTNLYAHMGATGIVKERMDSMSEMGDALGVMADMVKKKRPYNPDLVRESILIIERHANKLLEHFPSTKDSRSSKESDALPAIWESWDQFTLRSDRLEEEIQEFKRVTDGDLDVQQLTKEFRKIVKTCSACHEDFRRPKD